MTELVVVVFIIGLLAVLIVPKFSKNIRRANEAGSLETLTSIRSALNIYFNDNAGCFPADLGPLMQPGNNYLSALPPLYTADHGRSADVNYTPTKDGLLDTGNWGYVTAGSQQGNVWIQCTHTDSRGIVWSQY